MGAKFFKRSPIFKLLLIKFFSVTYQCIHREFIVFTLFIFYNCHFWIVRTNIFKKLFTIISQQRLCNRMQLGINSTYLQCFCCSDAKSLLELPLHPSGKFRGRGKGEWSVALCSCNKLGPPADYCCDNVNWEHVHQMWYGTKSFCLGIIE